jgi:hypothetical protein
MRPASRVESLCVALCIALAAPPAAAQVTISVPWNVINFGYFNDRGEGDKLVGQTFVVPTTHTVLQRFTYEVQATDPVTFELYRVAGGQLAGAPLVVQNVVPDPAFQTLVVAPPGGLTLIGGAPYAAMLRMAEGEQFLWLANALAPYDDGAPIECSPCAEFSFPFDIAFTATFVPEPSTVALVALGLGALAVGVARRRTG